MYCFSELRETILVLDEPFKGMSKQNIPLKCVIKINALFTFNLVKKQLSYSRAPKFDLRGGRALHGLELPFQRLCLI